MIIAILAVLGLGLLGWRGVLSWYTLATWPPEGWYLDQLTSAGAVLRPATATVTAEMSAPDLYSPAWSARLRAPLGQIQAIANTVDTLPIPSRFSVAGTLYSQGLHQYAQGFAEFVQAVSQVPIDNQGRDRGTAAMRAGAELVQRADPELRTYLKQQQR